MGKRPDVPAQLRFVIQHATIVRPEIDLLGPEVSQGLSRIMAEAWAPAAQILTSPYLALRRFI